MRSERRRRESRIHCCRVFDSRGTSSEIIIVNAISDSLFVVRNESYICIYTYIYIYVGYRHRQLERRRGYENTERTIIAEKAFEKWRWLKRLSERNNSIPANRCRDAVCRAFLALPRLYCGDNGIRLCTIRIYIYEEIGVSRNRGHQDFSSVETVSIPV